MSKLDTLIDNKIIQNVFIWFCLYLILLGTIQADERIITSLVAILLLAPAVYINNLLILPYFNKSKSKFFLFFLLNTTIFTVISVYIINRSIDQEFQFRMFYNFYGVLVLALTFGSALKISRDSFERRREEKDAELKLLKAQLNPHFLFNTLNNLYGLSVIKSEKLPGLMLKLSDLLRYSLYDTKETYVPLEKEIQYLENYMSLEKIRLEDQTEIAFNKTGNMSGKLIAPMLLIVFVENAFKHLASKNDRQSKVIVDIKVQDGFLDFQCINTKDASSKKENMESGKSGIGLGNAKKRLSFLYPEKHTLTIHEEGENYQVSLKLNL